MRLKKLTWGLFFLICIFNTTFLRAQLSDFTLQVTPITESCTANGTLNFVVANTTAGATILYTVYKLPNTTVPIAVMGDTTLTGLVSGNYRVVATQSLGGLSNTQQQDVFISDTIVDLNYILSGEPEICGNDGQISVYVTNSVAVSYEIFSGPVIRPLQTSNIFDNLPAGAYIVRVFDSCGEGLARTFTLGNRPPGLYINVGSSGVSGCNSIYVSNQVSATSAHALAFPLTITSTAMSPTGPPLVFTTTYNSGNFTQNFNFTVPTNYTTYDVAVTDGCGNHYTSNGLIINNPVMRVTLSTPIVVCDVKRIQVSIVNGTTPFTINFLGAPAGFNPLTFNPNHPGPFSGSTSYYNASVPLPQGTYTIQVVDACGRTATGTVSITTAPVGNVYYKIMPGCASFPNEGSIKVYGDNRLVSGQLISAPPGYPFPLPQDLSSYFTTIGTIQMGPLAAGTYVFSTVDICNGTKITTASVFNLNSGPVVATITENCDSFNLNFAQQTNAVAGYWMQEFDPVTNQWVHPISGYSGLPNQFNQLTAYRIIIGNNNNIQASGQFRIVRIITIVGNGMEEVAPCIEVVYNFQYIVGPRITNVYSFACENSLYDAIVIAQGYAPLKYRITSKNGQPFFVNNNFSNIFLGLEPTVYNFQIEDACGNILNSLFDISNPSLFPIQATTFCEGQSGSLAVPAFTFLNYQWRKDNDPTILSTTSTLNFPSFSAATNNGIYHVRVFYTGNPNSCVDFTVDYQINISSATPEAGTGQTISYCGSQGVIDLFSLLSGNYDNNGSWQEISNSGFLTNNLWNSTTVDSGNFQFKYTVNGSCGTFDVSNVGVIIYQAPQPPIATLEAVACDSKTLNLLATTIPFGNYLWTGPNGFTSAAQNPVIENITTAHAGTYTVKSYTSDCESAASNINVTVNPLPEFSFASGCVSNQYTIAATPINNSFNALSANYAWTGPNGYSSLQHPIQITNLPSGVYEVTVTNDAGCSAVQSIQVPGTQCEIPNVITPNDDFINDIFDLSGLLVDKLEVYNRWGRLVYQQNDYINQWHGQNNNNQQLPDSTYFYIAFLQSGENKQGWVLVNGQ